MSLPSADQLLDQSIAAYKGGDRDHASYLLARVMQIDPDNERAWLWLSGIVATTSERLFCIQRMLAINPENEIAQFGLTLLPPNLKPVQPSLQKLTDIHPQRSAIV